MIRVLHVIGAMDRGGAETMIMNLYRKIDRDRIQFDFLVHEQRECDFDQEIGRLGGRIFRLPRFNGINYVRYRHLCRVFFKQHPEYRIVHGHIGSCAAIYLNEAKRSGAFTIAHSHAQSFTPGLPGLAFRIASYPTRFIADRFFGCSYEAGKDRFGGKVVEDPRFAVLPNGIDLSQYAFNETVRKDMRKKLNIEGKAVFGHVGRLTAVKNHRFLLEVFSTIRQRIPDAVLILVGRGEMEHELRQLTCGMGIDSAVRFLGIREDVPDILEAMDVFLFPSIKEGLPLAAIEAQASGLPCIISTGVPKQVLVSDRASLLPVEDHADRWASIAVELYETAAQKGRSDCIDQVRAHGFDINETVKRLQAFYRAISDGKSVSFNEV